MNILAWGPLSHVPSLYSPFSRGLLAEDAGSRGGDQGGSSSYSSLGVCLHHCGYWLGGAECAGDGASNKAISQNNSWVKENIKLQTAHNSSTPCCFCWRSTHSVITRLCFRLRLLLLLLLLLSDYWCLLNSLCGNWCRRVKALHSYRCGLNALCSDWCWLDPLGADLCGWETNPIHCHQLHVVQMDSGRHAYSRLGGQCWTWGLRCNLLRGKKKLK